MMEYVDHHHIYLYYQQFDHLFLFHVQQMHLNDHKSIFQQQQTTQNSEIASRNINPLSITITISQNLIHTKFLFDDDAPIVDGVEAMVSIIIMLECVGIEVV